MGALHGPKGLLEVGGRVLLEHQMRVLAACGVARIVVVTGHQADRVEAAAAGLGLRTDIPVACARNPGFADTGTAMSALIGLRAAAPGDALLLEGDTLLTAPSIIDAIGDRTEIRTLTDRRARWEQGSKILTDGDGRVSDWLHSRHQGPGFSPEDATKTVNLTYLPAVGRSRLERVLAAAVCDLKAPLEFAFRDLALAGARIWAIEMAGRAWCEIDDPDDLARARAMPAFRDPPASTGWVAFQTSEPGAPPAL